MPDVTPDPKSRSLDRPRKRYRRKIASRKQWEAIVAEKGNACRVCASFSKIPGLGTPAVTGYPTEYHHLVARAHGGDDVAENIVPLCQPHHGFITERNHKTAEIMAENLTDAEYAYAIQRGGEGYFERAYGIEYTR